MNLLLRLTCWLDVWLLRESRLEHEGNTGILPPLRSLASLCEWIDTLLGFLSHQDQVIVQTYQNPDYLKSNKIHFPADEATEVPPRKAPPVTSINLQSSSAILVVDLLLSLCQHEPSLLRQVVESEALAHLLDAAICDPPTNGSLDGSSIPSAIDE
ncbi:unnamed protein product [Protopolystoma xenopodis]|uniref:Uncharacterized protein n=1 Tax=Protopolystoma xenopodis TaxID=117903 RepID=A0A448WI03_9PLAT|nr:unnamed protein product [Protopolystoma xenopodis]